VLSVRFSGITDNYQNVLEVHWACMLHVYCGGHHTLTRAHHLVCAGHWAGGAGDASPARGRVRTQQHSTLQHCEARHEEVGPLGLVLLPATRCAHLPRYNTCLPRRPHPLQSCTSKLQCHSQTNLDSFALIVFHMRQVWMMKLKFQALCIFAYPSHRFILR
jgi:hypothetical protein